MNIYSAITLCAVIFYFQISFVVFRIRRDKIHLIFALLAFCMAFYAGYQTVLYSPSPRKMVEFANFLFRLFGIASATVSLLSLFLLELSAKDWKRSTRICADLLVMALGLFFLVKNWFYEDLIREFVFQNGMWFEVITPLSASGLVYILFVYANFLFSLFLLVRWLIKAPSVLERTQARLLLAAALVSMTIHGFINYVLPFLSDQVLIPRITSICFIPLLFAIWYAIRKFQFLADIPKSVEKNPSWCLLTRREKEIISYLRRGDSFKRIGEVLFISEGTVRKHVENMRVKLGVRNRVELIYKVFAEDSKPMPDEIDT